MTFKYAESISLRYVFKCNKNQSSKRKSLCNMMPYVCLKHICMQIYAYIFPTLEGYTTTDNRECVCVERKEKLILHFILFCTFENRLIGLVFF